MLFHSSKKPTELSIIHLNKLQDKRQGQLKDALKTAKKTTKNAVCLANCAKKPKIRLKTKQTLKQMTIRVSLC